MQRSAAPFFLTTLGALFVLIAGARPLWAETTLFEFRSSFWINLHHYLHALGRNESPLVELPEAATAGEREAWQAALASYRSRYGGSGLATDEPLITLKAQLLAAPSAESLRGSSVRPEDATVLESVAPVYRRHVWLDHDQSNLRFVSLIQPLVSRYGECIARRVARSFDSEWPQNGIRTDVVQMIQAGTTVYTTSRPAHITVAVSDPRNSGLAGLEMLFREASRQWEPLLREEIEEAAHALRVRAPRDLPDAVLTYNAGEITRRVLAERGVSGYLPSIETTNVLGSVRPALAEHWPEVLDGRISRREALRRILKELAQAPKR